MPETELLGTSELVLGHDYEAGRAYWARFLQDVVSRGLPHERFVRWDTTASNLDEVLEHATHSSKLSWGCAAMLVLDTVADRQAEWSATANALKATVDFARKAVFLLSIAGAILAALASQMGSGATDAAASLAHSPRAWVATCDTPRQVEPPRRRAGPSQTPRSASPTRARASGAGPRPRNSRRNPRTPWPPSGSYKRKFAN